MRRISCLFSIALSISSSSVQGFNTVPIRERFFGTEVRAGCNNGVDQLRPQPKELNRRDALLRTTTAAVMVSFGLRKPANAAYVLDDESGDYVEVEDVDWQTVWKQRIDKASGMSQSEIFQAARGAGNVNLKEGEAESEASKKRRALSGCRDSKVRSTANAGSERDCTSRVLGGEYQFMLDAL